MLDRNGSGFIHRKQTPGEIIIGHGRFIDNNTVEITHPDDSKEQVTAEQFVIATGSRPKLIPGISIDGKYIYTSEEENIKLIN